MNQNLKPKTVTVPLHALDNLAYLVSNIDFLSAELGHTQYQHLIDKMHATLIEALGMQSILIYAPEDEAALATAH